MSASDTTPRTASAAYRLRDLLAGEGLVQVPGIYDPFSARAAQEMGFEAVALGGGVTVSVGYHVVPDMTMISTRDVIEVARGITRAIDIPLVVDFDEGVVNKILVLVDVYMCEYDGISLILI
jgi:2-methylisocitrate lyase-like PEP mutase family enzyme